MFIWWDGPIEIWHTLWSAIESTKMGWGTENQEKKAAKYSSMTMTRSDLYYHQTSSQAIPLHSINHHEEINFVHAIRPKIFNVCIQNVYLSFLSALDWLGS